MDAYSLGARIRRKRKELGKTLQQVADESKLSIGFLSRVERNDISPSLSSLAVIAKVLHSDVESFVSVPSNAGSVILSKDRARFSLPDGKAHYQQLSTDFPGKRINGAEVVLEPGFQTELMVHSGEELCVVLDGELTLTLNNKTQILSSGDSAHYSSAIPHQWRNTHEKPCRMMWFCDLDAVNWLCDDVYVMSRGQLEEQTDVHRLARHQVTSGYTRKLLAATHSESA